MIRGAPFVFGCVLAAFGAEAHAQFTSSFLGLGMQILDSNDAGQVVGNTAGLPSQPYVLSPYAPPQQLSLPAGFTQGYVEAINNYGVVVGSVSLIGFQNQTAAIWTPDPNGVYQVQLLTATGPDRSIAYDINDRGDVVGVTLAGVQYTTVWFNSPTGLLDLSALGAPLIPHQINNEGVLACTGGLFDIDTLQPVALPPLPANWSAFRCYSINDHGELGGQGERAGQVASAVWTNAAGWEFVGTLANFGSGTDHISHIGDDGLAVGGQQNFVGGSELVVRLANGSVVSGLSLLPGSIPFLGLGVAANSAGQIAVFSLSTSGSAGVHLLTSTDCQQTLGAQGPGPLAASFCGAGLAIGQNSAYVVTGAPPAAVGAMLVSIDGNANVPIFGGTLVSFGGFFTALPLASGPYGRAEQSVAGAAWPGIDFVVQAAFVAPGVAQGVTFSNAVRARLGQ